MDKDRVEGKLDDIKGRVKRQAGEWTGDKDMQAEGIKDQAKGKAEQVSGKIKDAARDAERDLRGKDKDKDEDAA